MLHPGPCGPWPVDLSCCPAAAGTDQASVDRWAKVATTILFNLSGRRWGPGCPVTIRPCGKSCIEDLIPVWYTGPQSGGRIPYIDEAGVWRNAVCGCKKTNCSCVELCELRLEGPVHDVLEVVVDGVVLPPEAYRVDSPNILVRLDGSCWDACQDLTAPPTVPGTSAVTYRIGLPLDDAAIAAHSELVCHLLRGCSGGGSCGCKANPNVTRLQRQGVDVEFTDLSLIYAEMRTGLPMTDLWLNTVNPLRRPQPSRVYSPDFKRPRQTIWP